MVRRTHCSCFIAFLLITCSRSQIFNISVEDGGVDVPSCVLGDVPCHSLDYVLLSLTNATCSTPASELNVNVKSSQSVSPAKYDFPCPLTLFIFGNEGTAPSLTCLAGGRLVLSSQTQDSVSVYWKNVRFVNCLGPDSYGLSRLSFNGCMLVNSGGTLAINTATVRVRSSIFMFGCSTKEAEAFFIVSHVESGQVYLTDATFAANGCTNTSLTATALWIVNSSVHIQGQITFANSTGLLGGALRLTRSQITANDNSSVLFFNNYAQFGSAVFVEHADCPVLNISKGYSVFTFQKNAVESVGQTQVYIDTPPLQLSTCFPNSSFYNVSFDSSQSQVSTSAVKASVVLPPGFSVIPGRHILLQVVVTDYFKSPATCAADVMLTVGRDAAPIYCNDARGGVELVCPFASPQRPRSEVLLSSADSFNSTLSLKSSVEVLNSTNMSVLFVCDDNARASVSFTLNRCPPFTMQFSNMTRSCECKKPRLLQSHFLCSVGAGAACIERGYWLASENVTAPLLAPCTFPYCREEYFLSSCPLTTNPDFLQLGDNPDDQCLGNRGGLLCRECSAGYYPTFPPIRCVETCSAGLSVGLLFIALAIQITKVILISAVFNTKRMEEEREEGAEQETKPIEPFDFAYFFGPLFCLSFLRRLPFQYLTQFQALSSTVSVYRTLVLPTLDLVSDIPWCFFPQIGALGIFAFNYLAPFLAYTIFGILHVVRKLRARGKIGKQPSGLRSLSLLILLSFWSLSYTSVGILRGINIDGLEGIRVDIEPQLVYLTRGHIPLFIIAVIITTLIFAFTVVLFSLPFLYCESIAKRLALMKPMMEHFQFCFKKGATWFGAVYFIVWMVMDVVPEYQVEYLLVFEMLLAAFCLLHYMVQPFKSLWANRIDTMILLSLLVCTSLLRYQLLRTESVAITVIVHLLVVALLVYLVLGMLALIAKQCGCFSRMKKINLPKLRGARPTEGSDLKQAIGDDDEDYNIFGGPATGEQKVINEADDTNAQYVKMDTQ